MGDFFVTGNGTGVGKTVVSAILAEALSASYWKPIQCGSLDYTDSMTVTGLVTNPKVNVQPEKYLLTQPLAPHAAAAMDSVVIELDSLTPPETTQPLIIEGVGGVLEPLNRQHTVADLIRHLAVPVVFVAQHYPGSINHALLSLEALNRRNIQVHGILFVGEPDTDTETVIINMSGKKMLGRIGWEDEISPGLVREYARLLREVL